jgi:C4-type Zn-finger protein
VSTPTPDMPDRPAVQEERLTVSRAALRLELLEMEVRLKDYFSGRITVVEGDIRDLQEANRLRDAAETALAEETERRRQSLSDTTSRWGILGNKTTLVVGLLAIGSLMVAAVNALHTIFN